MQLAKDRTHTYIKCVSKLDPIEKNLLLSNAKSIRPTTIIITNIALCLKIVEKVSFYNIASEASIKMPKMPNLASF